MKRSDSSIPIKLIVKNGGNAFVLKINKPQGNKLNLEKTEKFTNKEMSKQTPPIKINAKSPKIQLKLNKNNITFIDSPRSPLVPPSNEIDDSIFDEPIETKNETKIIQNNQAENRENVERNAKSDNEIDENEDIDEKHDINEFAKSDNEKHDIDEFDENDEFKEFEEFEEFEEFKEIIKEAKEKHEKQLPKRVFKTQPPIPSINIPKTPTGPKPKSFLRSKPVSHSHSIGSEMNIKTYPQEGMKKSDKFNKNKKKAKTSPRSSSRSSRSSRSSHSSGSESDSKSKSSIELPEIEFNSLQVRKYCEQAYSNDRFDTLLKLTEIFDAIRRILMNVMKADKKTSLDGYDLSIISVISNIPVSLDEKSNCLTFTKIILPAKEFDPEKWLKVYKEMLPEHGKLKKFNDESFKVLHKIFTQIRLIEASFDRDKIFEYAKEDVMEEMNEAMNQKINRELNGEIRKKQIGDYREAQNRLAWNIADPMIKYIEDNNCSVDNFKDTKIVSYWRIITGDVLIYTTPLMDKILKRLQIDEILFSQRALVNKKVVDIEKEKEKYSIKCRSIRDDFFNKYKSLTRETTTKQIWDEWKEYYLLFKSLILNLDYKLSQMHDEDIVILDSKLINVIRSVQEREFISFEDYNAENGNSWNSTYNPYNELELIDYNTSPSIQTIFNKVNDRNLQNLKYYLRMYPTEGVIGTFFNKLPEGSQMVFTKLLSELNGHREVIEKYVIDIIVKKNITDSFWRFFIALIAEDLIDSNVINRILNDFPKYDHDIRISLIEPINFMIKFYSNELTNAILFLQRIVEPLEKSLKDDESTGYKMDKCTETLIINIKEFITKPQN